MQAGELNKIDNFEQRTNSDAKKMKRTLRCPPAFTAGTLSKILESYIYI